MRKLLRFLIVVVIVVPAIETQAGCERYQCRIYPDTADCLIRMGPNSTQFPLATSCQGVCDTMPDPSGTGTLNYDCYCTYDYCYDV